MRIKQDLLDDIAYRVMEGEDGFVQELQIMFEGGQFILTYAVNEHELFEQTFEDDRYLGFVSEHNIDFTAYIERNKATVDYTSDYPIPYDNKDELELILHHMTKFLNVFTKDLIKTIDSEVRSLFA